jgi:hypothetical protein
MQKNGSYHGRLLASRIVYKHESGIEVIEIDLALSLKLVEEVEKTKRKGGAGSNASCWEPAGTKELATAGGRFLSAVLA